MIRQGVSLKTYNSFRVAAEAALFTVAKTIEDLQDTISYFLSYNGPILCDFRI